VQSHKALNNRHNRRVFNYKSRMKHFYDQRLQWLKKVFISSLFCHYTAKLAPLKKKKINSKRCICSEKFNVYKKVEIRKVYLYYLFHSSKHSVPKFQFCDSVVHIECCLAKSILVAKSKPYVLILTFSFDYYGFDGTR